MSDDGPEIVVNGVTVGHGLPGMVDALAAMLSPECLAKVEDAEADLTARVLGVEEGS